jgi:ribose 5-phosphate isomerase RpiB
VRSVLFGWLRRVNRQLTEHAARQHNNANALALPVRFVSLDTALAMVAAFVDTPFEGGRHATSVDKIKCK